MPVLETEELLQKIQTIIEAHPTPWWYPFRVHFCDLKDGDEGSIRLFAVHKETGLLIDTMVLNRAFYFDRRELAEFEQAYNELLLWFYEEWYDQNEAHLRVPTVWYKRDLLKKPTEFGVIVTQVPHKERDK